MLVAMPMDRRPRLLCDAMLGSLARWLRLAGHDCAYEGPEADDAEVAARAVREERWLLTRDRELASLGPRTLLVRSSRLEDQLVEVLGRLRLTIDDDLARARCPECNGVLATVAAAEVADVAPPYVLATAAHFRRCRQCGRVYWPGTHTTRIRRQLRAVAARLAQVR